MSDIDHLIDELSDDLQPVRPVRLAEGHVLLAAAVTVTGLVAAAGWGFSASVRALEPSQAALVSVGLFVLLGVAGSRAAISMARPAVGPVNNGWRWAAAAVAVLPAAALTLLMLGLAQPIGLALQEGIRCLAAGLAGSLASAVALTLWLRRGAPVRVDGAAWLVGLTSGAIGALTVSLTCADDALTHVGLWHVAVVAIAAIVARLIVPPLVRW